MGRYKRKHKGKGNTFQSQSLKVRTNEFFLQIYTGAKTISFQYSTFLMRANRDCFGQKTLE